MSILLFIIVLVVLIIVHEFGHFSVAKYFKIRVDEFGIGFPPKAVTLWKGKETEYTLNWLPFGGFVRIFGESLEDTNYDGPDKERSFLSKSKWVQAAVLVAGVAFNALFAWVLFSIAFMAGMPAAAGEDMPYTLENERLMITMVLPDSPASAAGLREGDVIQSLNTEESSVQPALPEDVAAFIGTAGGGKMEMTVMRGNEEKAIVVAPEMNILPGDDAGRYAIGIEMVAAGTLSLPPHLAIWEGGKMTVRLLGAVTVALGTFVANAFTFSADFSQIAGPVGIVGLVGTAADLGIVPLLTFTALISLNLAVINLLPFPALDGGRLLFVAIEALKGSPIRPSIAHALNQFGFALLIILLLVVTYHDIVRIF